MHATTGRYHYTNGKGLIILVWQQPFVCGKHPSANLHHQIFALEMKSFRFILYLWNVENVLTDIAVCSPYGKCAISF